MKAYVLRAEADGMALELREKSRPEPGSAQLLVRVRAASLNRGELIRGHGLIKPGTEKPAGMDAAGEVVGTSERVMGRLPGAFAEYGLMDKQDAIPIPPNLSWEEAGAVPITFLVVYDMLVQQGNLKSGEWLLVTGVSAGVGVAALQAGQGARGQSHRPPGASGKTPKPSAPGPPRPQTTPETRVPHAGLERSA